MAKRGGCGTGVAPPGPHATAQQSAQAVRRAAGGKVRGGMNAIAELKQQILDQFSSASVYSVFTGIYRIPEVSQSVSL
jgi:hypothetical protein